MPCVSKTTCTPVIVISLWLICHIQCGFSISYLSIPAIAAHDGCNISHVFTFFLSALMWCCFYYYYSDLFCLQSFMLMYVLAFHVPLFFFLRYRIKNNSPILCQLFVTTTFRDVFKSLKSFLLYEDQWVKSMKNVAQ